MKAIPNAVTPAIPFHSIAQQIVLWLVFPIVMVGAVCEVATTAFLVGTDWAAEQLDELMED